MLPCMETLTSHLIVDLLRLYFDALLDAKGDGALADFGRKYKIPDYTISRIRSGTIKLPRADIFLNILQGMKDIPFSDLKKHLPNYFDPVSMNKISKLEGKGLPPQLMDLLVKFTDIVSDQVLLDAGLVSALFGMVNSLHAQLGEIKKTSPPAKAPWFKTSP